MRPKEAKLRFNVGLFKRAGDYRCVYEGRPGKLKILSNWAMRVNVSDPLRN